MFTGLICATLMQTSNQWSADQANAWQAKQPWVVGCNFLPSTAINQLEMWQSETFDPTTIDRELGYAESIGMNTVRVYLHDIAYEVDPTGFKSRIEQFLTIADKHKIRPLFVFFDDCWNPDPKPGLQPKPKQSVHNSGWVRSPGDHQRNWPADLPRLEKYVTDILKTHKNDKRIYAWDLYNEPGNSGYDEKSLPLLKKVFEWGWSVRPSQPMTVGVWYGNEALNNFQTANSDVISFHNYNDAQNLQAQIDDLRKFKRPLINTEWMARTNNSRVLTHLPIFHKEKVACINWGLVNGKSNTIYAWGTAEGAPEPNPWFHDLFHPNGNPYDKAETDLFKKLTGRGN